MYGPTDSSATHASNLWALQRLVGEVELCVMMVPAEPVVDIWRGTAKDLYSAQLGDLRQRLNELHSLMSSAAAEFQALAAAQ